ncbi:MAG: hypothetical protein RR643_04940 [Anaerorhabdus sp.]|uniref:hypothetical protein n=1 Tax=Anaerorhabdus sp. TaxID=1872524 RepID=UPI002FC9FCFD
MNAVRRVTSQYPQLIELQQRVMVELGKSMKFFHDMEATPEKVTDKYKYYTDRAYWWIGFHKQHDTMIVQPMKYNQAPTNLKEYKWYFIAEITNGKTSQSTLTNNLMALSLSHLKITEHGATIKNYKAEENEK